MDAGEIKPEFITCRQASEILGCCELTIRRWIDDGRLKGYRLGSRLVRVKYVHVLRLRKLLLRYEEDLSAPRDTRLGTLLKVNSDNFN